MPAEFVQDKVETGPSIGTCAGCGVEILAGAGIRVAASGERFHPDCRTVKPAQVKRPRKPRTEPVDGMLGE